MTSLNLPRSTNLGNLGEAGHLGHDKGLEVVHCIVWVDRLHLLLPPEAHIELPAKRKVHVMEIQNEDVGRMEMMEEGRYV